MTAGVMDAGAIAALVGRATEGAAAILGTALTATKGVIGESTATGTSDGNGVNGNGVNDNGDDNGDDNDVMFGEGKIGTGADDNIGPVRTVTARIVCAYAGHGAAKHAAINAASARLTRSL